MNVGIPRFAFVLIRDRASRRFWRVFETDCNTDSQTSAARVVLSSGSLFGSPSERAQMGAESHHCQCTVESFERPSSLSSSMR
jgi:hypothetical protein